MLCLRCNAHKADTRLSVKLCVCVCLLYGKMFAFNTFAVSVIIFLAIVAVVVLVLSLVFRKLNNICGKQVCLVYVLKMEAAAAAQGALEIFVWNICTQICIAYINICIYKCMRVCCQFGRLNELFAYISSIRELWAPKSIRLFLDLFIFTCICWCTYYISVCCAYICCLAVATLMCCWVSVSINLWNWI